MDRRGWVLLIWIGACTGSPLPNGDDELGEGTSTSASATGSGTDASSEGTSSEGTSAETDTSSTQADTSSGESTTGTACTTPEVVTFLMIDADTPAEGLYCLREVEQSLQIKDVDWIDLSYLPALERVGGLWIYDVDSMTSLSGTSLTEIGTLTLTGMPALTSTAGLEQLVGLESLYVGGLPMLAKVELPAGLPTERIDAYIEDLDMLTDLQPQPSGPAFAVTIGSSAHDISGLMACCDFPQLSLHSYSEVLTDFSDLQGLTSMQGLHVFNAAQLVDLSGLEQLESIGTLEIAGGKCDMLEGWQDLAIHIPSLAGLDSLASIGALELRYLFELNSLEGLPLDATVDTLELRNLTTLTQAQADAFASAVQAQSSTICGLEGDEFCYLSRAEAAPCPQ